MIREIPDNLRLMHSRLGYHGGAAQQDRMIKDKRWTFDHTVKYSYQAAKVRDIDKKEIVPALINPNKLKQDYDDKIVSIGYEHGFKPGTVFEWMNTGTKWLIYLQDLTELAYFKGDIRRCSFSIDWRDEEGELHTVYAAIRGPVETKINFIQKSGISVDVPNHSLNILIPKNKYTLEYFQRYSKFYLQGLEEGDKNICWRVEANDSISMPGILELTAVEYYSNEYEDDLEQGLVGELIVKPIVPEVEGLIQGEEFIKPKLTYTYLYTGTEDGEWSIDSRLPIEKDAAGKKLTIKWLKTYSGEFTIKYGNSEKTVVVESLF